MKSRAGAGAGRCREGTSLPDNWGAALPTARGQCGKTAGCKVDLAFDLLDGDIVYHQLHPGTEQDKTIGYDLP